jgi:hypothetical protein
VRVKELFKALLSFLFGSTEAIKDTDRGSELPGPSYATAFHGSQHEALQAAKSGAVLAIVESSGRRKWAMLRCPCGCGEVLAMNLMPTHRPRWDVQLNAAGEGSLYPSVDSTKCGAHFWLRSGRVVWALASRPHHS